MPMIGIGEPVPKIVERLDSRARGARARRRPPGRRAQPLRPAQRSSRRRRPGERTGAGRAGFETRAIHAGQDAGPGDRRGRAADPPGDDVRRRTRSASTSGFEYGRTRQPDPRRARGLPRRRSKARRAGSRSRAAWPPRTRCCARSSARATTSSSPTTRTAARSGSCRKVLAPTGRRLELGRRSASTDALRAAWTDATQGRLGRDADEPDARRRRHRRGRGGRARARRDASSSTTRSRRRTSSSRSSSAPTSSCTRPRSTSAGTPTSSAGSSRSPTPSWASGSRSCRTRSARCRARSTATSCCAGSRRSAVRMDRHCENARAVAEMLDAHPAVDRVLYPGLAVASRPRGRGPPDARLRRDGELPRRRRARTPRSSSSRAREVFTLAESLGAVESLIEHPARMTHASAAGSPLAVDPALVRLSVGIETVADLLADLEQRPRA